MIIEYLQVPDYHVPPAFNWIVKSPACRKRSSSKVSGFASHPEVDARHSLRTWGWKWRESSSHLTHAFVEKQVGARGEIESVSWAAVRAQLAMIPCSSCDLGVSRQDWFSAGKCEVPKLFQCWKRGWPQQLSVNEHGNEISTICSCPWEFPLPCNIIRKYLPENHPELLNSNQAWANLL